jgi:hypothetical protein
VSTGLPKQIATTALRLGGGSAEDKVRAKLRELCPGVNPDKLLELEVLYAG